MVIDGLGDDGGREQRHRLDRVLGGGVVDVDVDGRPAGDLERRGADALDLDAEALEVEAQVLDHVVGRGVADHGGAGVEGGGHQRVLGDRVAALGQHDRARRLDGAVDAGVVAAVARLDVEPEGTQRRHVRLDRALAEVAAAGVGEVELVVAVQQRAEEHDHRARASCCRLVDRGEVEVGGRDDLQVVVVADPAGGDAEGVEHLEQAVDLLDARDLAQRRTALVEQGGAQQRDAGVLGGLDVDRAGQRRRAVDAQVRRAGAEGDDLGVECRADAREHLEGEVLVALLDAVDGALAGAEQLCQLVLGEPAVLAGVADEVADATLVVSHADHGISDMR